MVRMAKVWTVRGGDLALINCGDLYESVSALEVLRNRALYIDIYIYIRDGVARDILVITTSRSPCLQWPCLRALIFVQFSLCTATSSTCLKMLCYDHP